MAKEKLWSALIHLGGNMWNEEGNWNGRAGQPGALASPVLRLDRGLWDRYMENLVRVGANAVIIDVGEGMLYESHPELAVEGSWTKDEVAKEVARLRAMGLEPIPKLNFSAGHDIWLQEYSYMLATRKYRDVCADLIREVCEAFTPKHFHLGMDEETWGIQKDYYYAVIRQHDVWWRDFYHLVACCEKANARPWIWSDYCWAHPEEFYKKMPRSVVQCNWYYSMALDPAAITDEKRKLRLEAFEELDRQGFDQVPTGSNWSHPANMQALTEYCTNHISDEHLMGFMQTPWCLFTEDKKDHLDQSVEKLGESIAWYNNQK